MQGVLSPSPFVDVHANIKHLSFLLSRTEQVEVLANFYSGLLSTLGLAIAGQMLPCAVTKGPIALVLNFKA